MLGVIFALKHEAIRLGPGAVTSVSGSGRENAGRAAEQLVAGRALSGLISAGFAGALSPALRLGELVVDTEVAEWLALARQAGATEGRIVTVDQVAHGVNERLELAARTGAVALDMESAAVAAVARRHRLRYASVRAITDTLDRRLVLDWDRLPAPGGRYRLLPMLSHALRTPGGLAEIAQLWYASRLASRNLGHFLRELLGRNGWVGAGEGTGP